MPLNELRSHSYAPYSDRPAVCVVKSAEGRFFPGVRVENIAFPLTISAAKGALFSCISEGDTPRQIFVDPGTTDDLQYLQEQFQLTARPLGELSGYRPPDLLLPSDELPVGETLKGLLKRAQTPQSDFPVSALLETPQGYVSGVNIETPDWSFGLCAERVAIAKALSLGLREFHALHVHTAKGEFSSPCGACRQVIFEHMPDRQVHLHHADGSRSDFFASELLPYSFHFSDLKKHSTRK